MNKQNLTRCALGVNVCSIGLSNYFLNNRNITSQSMLVNDISNIIFNSVAELRVIAELEETFSDKENLGNFLKNLSNKIIEIDRVSSEILEEDDNKNSIILDSFNEINIASLLFNSIKDRIAREANILPVENKVIDTDRENKDESFSTSNENNIDDNDILSGGQVTVFPTITVEDEELGDGRTGLSSVNLNIDKIAEKYFSNISNLMTEFKIYFLEKFEKNLINAEVNGKNQYMGIMSTDIHTVLVNTLEDVKADLNDNLINNIEGKEKIERGYKENRTAFYADIIYNNFNGIVRAYLPGVNITMNSEYIYMNNKKIRKSYATYDGSFSGFDQATEAVKMYLNLTPRLRVDQNTDVITQDKNSPHLSQSEYKMVSDELGYLSADMDEFVEGLEALSKTMDAKSHIFLSIYNKFFNPKSYIVDGIEKESFLTIARQNSDESLDNIMSAILTDLRSKQVVEHIISDNGTIIITTLQNAEVASLFKTNFNINVTEPTDLTTINRVIRNKISTRVSYDELEDKTYKKKFNIVLASGLELSYKSINIENKNGVPVNIDDVTREKLLSPKVVRDALLDLGMPSYISEDFIKYYTDNISTVGSNTGDISIANLVGNLAYMVLLNIETKGTDSRVEAPVLKDFGWIVDKNITIDDNTEIGLPFPIFDTMHGFTKPIQDFLHVKEGIGAKKFFINIDGNKIATTSTKARLADIPKVAERLRDSGKHAFNGNTLVDGLYKNKKNEYGLLGFKSKSGITHRNVKKGNSSMSFKEQMKYLVEGCYLHVASKSFYKNALIQPGVPADRTNVEMGHFVANGSKEFLPQGGKALNILKKDLLLSNKNQHNNTANAVVGAWKQQLKEWSKDKKLGIKFVDIISIKSLRDLDIYLDKTNIPIEKIKSSTLLVINLMYNKNTGKLNKTLVEMHAIWNDDIMANNYLEHCRAKFFYDLGDYNEGSLSSATLALLKHRFTNLKTDRQLFERLMNSYFYQSNILSSSTMELGVGSVYQFASKNEDNTDIQNEGLDNEDSGSKNMNKKFLSLDLKLSSSFLDQSKRNASLGSSFQHPRLVNSKNRGKYLDVISHSAVITDKKLGLKILGDLREDLKQDVYDACSFGHPLYFLKLNNSLGKDMSAYISKGGAVKDISNEVNYLTGIFRFQKKATFNMFSNEMLKKGSKELITLFEKMNTSVPLDLEHGGIVYKNLQELWESVGSYNNENSWAEVLDILSEYPDKKNLYIDRISFSTNEKTGSSGINTEEDWSNEKPLLYTEFSNEQHGLILNPDHEPDTTASQSVSYDGSDSQVSLLTQIIAAASFEGKSMKEVDSINETLYNLADIGLDRVKYELEQLELYILDKYLKKPSGTPLEGKDDIIKKLRIIFDKQIKSEEDNKEIKKQIEDLGINKKASHEWARELTEAAIASRESFGITTDLVQMGENAPLDSLQLQRIVHSSIKAKLNKDTVRLKFKGGQYVVSASLDFIKSYKVDGKGRGLQRDEYMHSDSTKATIIYSIEDLDINPSDPIWIDGEEKMYIEVRGKKDFLENLSRGLVSFKILPEAGRLQWLRYKRLVNGVYKYLEDEPIYKQILLEKDINKRKDLYVHLKTMLEDEAQVWSTDDAEFYMPQLHAAAYNLVDSDTLYDVMGDYSDDIVAQTKHMVEFFTQRITNNDRFRIIKKDKKLDKYNLTDYDAIDKNTSIIDINNIVKNLSKDILTIDTTSLNHKILLDIINMYNNILKNYNNIDDTNNLGISDINKINNNLIAYKKSFINSLAEQQAANFPKTLEFLSGRIPSHSKQSACSSKVKGFITSQRNNIYGPPEALTITGADHDVDKSNIMVYSVDNNGVIYTLEKYKGYLEGNGTITSGRYNEYIKNKSGELASQLVKLNLKTKEINKAIKKFKKNEYIYFTEANKNNILNNLLIIMRSPKNAIETNTPIGFGDLNKYIPSTQDIIAYNISSNNTIEDDSALFLKDKDTHYIHKSNMILSPMNPVSIPVLEILNYSGKSSVGIMATGIKGFAVTSTAWMKGIEENSPYIIFSNEANKLFSDNLDLLKLYQDIYGKEDKNSLVLYDRDKKTSETETIANTSIHTQRGKTALLDAKNNRDYIKNELLRLKENRDVNIKNSTNNEQIEDINKIYNADLEDLYSIQTDINERRKFYEDNNYTDEQIVEDILKDTDVQKIIHDYHTEPQVWESLSQLLAAATDNAKVLILSRINATSTTNGIIVTGLILGHKMDDIFRLLKDTKVVELIKAVEDSIDTTSESDIKSFDTVLKNYIKETFLSDKSDTNIKTRFTDITASINYAKIKLNATKANIHNNSIVTDIKGTMKDVKIYSLNNYNLHSQKFLYSSNDKLHSISDQIITVEPWELNRENLMLLENIFRKTGLDINNSKISKEQLLALYKLVSNVTQVIIDQKLESSNMMAALAILCSKKEIPVPIYSVNFKGNWSEYQNGSFQLVGKPILLQKKTAYLSNTPVLDKLVTNSLREVAQNTSIVAKDENYINTLLQNNLEDLENIVVDLEKSLKDMMIDYVSNGPRQVLELLKAAAEQRTITHLLAINQGLPNGDYDEFEYMYKFCNGINKIVGDKFINIEDFKKFILAVCESDTNTYEKTIEQYEKYRTAINPFYVLSKNKHYLGYIKSQIFGSGIMQEVTIVNKLIENIAWELGVDDSDKYSSVKNFVYGATIRSFFNDSDYTKEFTYNGVTYNLSDNVGSNNFLHDMPSILKEVQKDPLLTNNAFIHSLKLEDVKDARLQTKLTIIRTNNLSDVHEDVKIQMKLGAKQLKDLGGDYEKLYDALFFYTLVLNKGGKNKHSFASLFGIETDAYAAYIKYINELKYEKVKSILETFGNDGLLLNAPGTIKEYSTFDDGKRKTKHNVDGEDSIDMENEQESMYLDINVDSDYERLAYKDKVKTNKAMFYKMLELNKINPNIYRSKELGKIFMRHNDYGYIVLTPVLSTKGIAYDNKKNNIFDATGWQYGVTTVISEDGDLGQVYKYNDKGENKGKYMVIPQGKKQPIFMTAQDLHILNKDMIFFGPHFGKATAKELTNYNTKFVSSDVESTSRIDTTNKGRHLSELFKGIPNNENRVWGTTNDDGSVSKASVIISDLNIGLNSSKPSTIIRVGNPKDRSEYKLYKVTFRGPAEAFLPSSSPVNVQKMLGYSSVDNAKKLIKSLKDNVTTMAYTVTPYHEKTDMSNIGKGTAVPKGTYDKLLLKSNITYNEEHLLLASMATIAYSLGSGPTSQAYNEELHLENVTRILPSDSVWLSGDTLYENFDAEGNLSQMKLYIDDIINSGAEILLGNGSGFEEAARTYVMEKHPLYSITEYGFKRGEPFALNVKDNVSVFHTNNVAHFNTNSIVNTPKAFGTTFMTYAYKGNIKSTEYKLAIDSKSTREWNSTLEAADVIAKARKFNTKSSSIDWDEKRDILIENEETFVKNRIKAYILSKGNHLDGVETMEQFNEISDVLLDQEEFTKLYNKIFDENGKFKRIDENGKVLFPMTAQLAMAKNRNITIKILRENMPEIFARDSKDEFFELLSRYSDNTELNKEFDNDGLSEEDIELINSDGNNITYRDMYYYITTLDSDKVYTNGQIRGENVNNFLAQQGISAFSLNSKEIIVIDSRAIIADKVNTFIPNAKTRDQRGPVTFNNTEKSTMASRKVGKKVMYKVLNRLFGNLDIKYRILSSVDIENEFGAVYTEKSGWITSIGEIVINIDKATLDTPLHEFGGHIYLMNLRNTNIDAYDSIIKLSLSHPIRSTIADNYPDLTEEELGEEIFATLYGLQNQSKLYDATSLTLWDKITNIVEESESFLDFFKRIFKNVFNTDIDFVIDKNDSLLSIIDKMGNDVIYKEGSPLAHLEAQDKYHIDDAKGVIENEESITKELEKLNNIQIICI